MTSKARNIADLGSNDVIETTSTGVDVTGTVTADGLTVDGNSNLGVEGSGSQVTMQLPSLSSSYPTRLVIEGDYNSGTSDVDIKAIGVSSGGPYGANLNFYTSSQTSVLNRMKIANNGNVSFYEDTGTTAKMVWDASAESLGIGGSPATNLDVRGNVPTIRLSDTDISSSWSDNKEMGRLEFYTTDGSGNAPYDTAYISAVNGFSGGTLPSGELVFATATYNASGGAVERMRIDDEGNVGIGTSSPGDPLSIQSASNGSTIKLIGRASDGYSTIAFRNNADDASLAALFADDSSDSLQIHTAGAERARITSSGSFLINTSGVLTYGDAILQSNGGSNNWGATFESSATSASRGAASFVVQNTGAPLARFHYVSTSVGDITTNGTAVSYGSNSDYRLKENVTTITDASERLKALKPCRFNFISHPDKTVDGFLAHEAQEVVPEAVTGTKDAMRTEEYEVSPAVEATYDEDGNELTPAVEAVMGTREVPDYQGIDQSKIVPLLTKALQEALTRIEALENANGNS